MASPADFRESLVALQPSGQKYSESEVTPLPVWTDGELSVSCWKLSLRERLLALLFGRAWISMLVGGDTQPPVALAIHPTFFAGE